jgi:hypothetical protein
MTISKTALLILPALLLIGCSNTPENAVSNLYDAIKEGNAVKMANNGNDNINIFFTRQALEKCSVDKTSYTDDIKLANDCLKENYKDLEYKNIKITKVTEDNVYAELEVTNNNVKNNVTLLVKYIDGKWTVLGFKKAN